MFDNQYRFYGRHADRVDALTAVFDSEGKAKLFERNVDVYINAPLVGFLYNRKADRDQSPGANDRITNVMGDRVIKSSDRLKYNYRLIMMLDSNYEADATKRIDKAFRNSDTADQDMELFDSYVRGGIDVLYEKLIEGASSPDEYIGQLFNFIEEFAERFNETLSGDIIVKMCQDATSKK